LTLVTVAVAWLTGIRGEDAAGALAAQLVR
jgi:hypothetical protein